MRRSDAKVALEAANQWDQRGLLQPGALEQIRHELAPLAATTSLATQTLYVIGSILLGAATAALYALMRDANAISSSQELAWVYFVGCGAVMSLAGLVIWLARARELGDAILMASLVPWAITLGPETYHEGLRLLPAAVGGAILAWRRHDRLLPVLGYALAVASIVTALGRSLGDEAITAWWLAALVVYGATTAWMRYDGMPWRLESELLSSGHLAVATLIFIIEHLNPGFQADTEVLYGLALLGLIGAGVLMQQRGTVGVAAGAITIDAIVFAFDVGGPVIGFVVLLGLSGALIAAATALRRRREAA